MELRSITNFELDDRFLSTMVAYFVPAVVVFYFLLKKCVLERISIGQAGRWVFITGCDSGFGKRTVLRLIQKRVFVFAGCYTQKGREDLEREAGAISADASSRLITVRLDITSDQSVSEAFDVVKNTLNEKNAKLWAIVNNAGIFPVCGPADWCSLRQYSDSFNVNCLGAVRMCLQFLPLLKQSKGRIVTMGSSAGRMHGQFLAPYCASKFAVEAYMDCLRIEMRQFGVSVHILEPGAFKTELLSEEALNARVDNIWRDLSEKTREEYGETYRTDFKIAWNEGVRFAASSNLDWVVDHYEHALFSFWPRLRYYPGWDSVFLFVPLSMMPSYMQDCVLTFLYKFKPGPSLVPQALDPSRRRRSPA